MTSSGRLRAFGVGSFGNPFRHSRSLFSTRVGHWVGLRMEMGKTMLPIEPQVTTAPESTTVNQRFQPQAKLPGPDVLRMMAPGDVRALKLLLSQSADYIHHELLDAPDIEQSLFGEASDPNRSGDDSGVFQLGGPADTGLNMEPEPLLFVRLNYCRRRVCQLLERFDGKRLNLAAVYELLRWERAAHEIRSRIVRDNLPLVLAMTKRTRLRGVDPADLISEGSLALLRAANKFDCSRGYKFSTYACRAILKSFSRVATRTTRYRGHFPTEFDPMLEKSNYVERRRMDVAGDCVEELRTILEGNLGRLSDIEKRVIQARFALDGDDDVAKGKTLEQVGELIGVTKERVRQIQNKALGKLRLALDQVVLT